MFHDLSVQLIVEGGLRLNGWIESRVHGGKSHFFAISRVLTYDVCDLIRTPSLILTAIAALTGKEELLGLELCRFVDVV